MRSISSRYVWKLVVISTFSLSIAMHGGNATDSAAAENAAHEQGKLDWPALRPFEEKAAWPTPKLGDDNYRKWITFIRPTEKELKWKKIRWHKSLSVAAAEARRLKRPILLWTMNGHPCGET